MADITAVTRQVQQKGPMLLAGIADVRSGDTGSHQHIARASRKPIKIISRATHDQTPIGKREDAGEAHLAGIAGHKHRVSCRQRDGAGQSEDEACSKEGLGHSVSILSGNAGKKCSDLIS